MTGIWVDVAFWTFAVAAVWFGWRVFRTDSMVRATFSLLVSFLNVGAILILLLAEYLGVAIFFMMTVEMGVMAIYMVAFMMNPAGLNPMNMVHQPRLAIGVGVATTVGLSLVALRADLPDEPLLVAEDTIRQLGHELMGGSMLVMQTVGITLMTTMIAAVVLSAARGRFGPAAEGSLPPGLDPDDPDSQPAGHRPPDGNGGHGGHHGHGGHGGHG